jgi:transposase
MDTAASSIGVTSPAKELTLRREASLLMQVEEQMEETEKALMNTLSERMKQDTDIFCSMKGIGENTATSFLIEMGGVVEIYENGKKLIAAPGLDPSTYESGKYKGKSRINKRGNRHLRRVIWLMATRVIISNDLFKTYFKKRKRDGLLYKKAVLATTHRLICTIFVILRRRMYFVEGEIKYS